MDGWGMIIGSNVVESQISLCRSALDKITTLSRFDMRRARPTTEWSIKGSLLVTSPSQEGSVTCIVWPLRVTCRCGLRP